MCLHRVAINIYEQLEQDTGMLTLNSYYVVGHDKAADIFDGTFVSTKSEIFWKQWKLWSVLYLELILSVITSTSLLLLTIT